MKVISTVGERNEVTRILTEAIEEDYDSVFLIASKGKKVHTVHSGYQDIERKIGALEILKHDLITSA